MEFDYYVIPVLVAALGVIAVSALARFTRPRIRLANRRKRDF